MPRFNQGRQARPTERLEPLNNLADDTSVYYGEKKRVMRHTKEIKVKEMGARRVSLPPKVFRVFREVHYATFLRIYRYHGLRTPNEGINQRYLKNWADVADKICFNRT